VYVFPTEGTKKWDSCAPEAVLTCAGGTITDIKGDPLNYTKSEDVANRHGMLATARNHSVFVEKLRGRL
jgi:3'(2'), 5'-bisphosphate nucleotidase